MSEPAEPGAASCWAIITGEYPRDHGGVSDHSRQLAEALVREGHQVVVLAPGRERSTASETPLLVRLPKGFGPLGLSDLGRVLDALPPRRRILVQYVPHALGMKSMNLPFCAWLRSRREPVDILFHEVAVPWGFQRSWLDNLLGAAHRLMARLVGRQADRLFVTTEAWIPLLERLGIRSPTIVLPVPSNLPTEVDVQRVRTVRARLDPASDGQLVGHFGTFGAPVADMVTAALGNLLTRASGHKALLIGRGSLEYRAGLAARWPDMAVRLLASGDLGPAEAAEHLAACDVLLQPYPDGVTTRRTTLMSGLALGIPIVSNRGPLTEEFWADSGALALCDTIPEIATATEALLADPGRRKRLGARGAALYRERFELAHTVRALLAVPD